MKSAYISTEQVDEISKSDISAPIGYFYGANTNHRGNMHPRPKIRY
jgi:hypothetical protein